MSPREIGRAWIHKRILRPRVRALAQTSRRPNLTRLLCKGVRAMHPQLLFSSLALSYCSEAPPHTDPNLRPTGLLAVGRPPRPTLGMARFWFTWGGGMAQTSGLRLLRYCQKASCSSNLVRSMSAARSKLGPVGILESRIRIRALVVLASPPAISQIVSSTSLDEKRWVINAGIPLKRRKCSPALT